MAHHQRAAAVIVVFTVKNKQRLARSNAEHQFPIKFLPFPPIIVIILKLSRIGISLLFHEIHIQLLIIYIYQIVIL